jgi:hypothetical protein
MDGRARARIPPSGFCRPPGRPASWDETSPTADVDCGATEGATPKQTPQSRSCGQPNIPASVAAAAVRDWSSWSEQELSGFASAA